MSRESAATTLARVAATLELALYRNHNALAPRDPIALANETFRRLTRDERIIERLLALADDALEATDPRLDMLRQPIRPPQENP